MCQGLTKTGTICKRKGTHPGDMCNIHFAQSEDHDGNIEHLKNALELERERRKEADRTIKDLRFELTKEKYEHDRAEKAVMGACITYGRSKHGLIKDYENSLHRYH